MAKTLAVETWAALVKESAGTGRRNDFVGVSITLAARLLGVSRSRVHQLVRGKKLNVLDVVDERQARIAHMVTLASIARRQRRVRPRRTQWRSARIQQ
jgi:hypothetical protein